jgi:hypothetical protein
MRSGRPFVALATWLCACAPWMFVGGCGGGEPPAADRDNQPDGGGLEAADAGGKALGRDGSVAVPGSDGGVSLATRPAAGLEGFLAFRPAMSLPAGSGTAVTTGDLNGDGRPDLVVVGAITAGAVSNDGLAFVNQGGSFVAAPQFFTASTVTSLTLGDISGDHLLDLVTIVNFGPGFINLLVGDGKGAFSAPSAVTLSGASFAGAAVVADFNRDGLGDVAATNNLPNNELAIFLNGAPAPAHYAIPDAQAIAVGDWNADGQPDLAVGAVVGTMVNLTILTGRADGTFVPMPVITFPENAGVISLGSGDFNGDGLLDVVVASARVYVGIGQGDATFTWAQPAPLAGGVLNLETGDFNGGGRLDVAALVVPGAGQAFVRVLLGDGAGGLEPALTVGGFDTTGVMSGSLSSGDYDGDKRPDLVVAHGATVDLFFNSSSAP